MGLSVAWVALGFIISFYPGSELYWWAMGAGQFLVIVLISHKDIRAVAAAFMIFCLFFAILGYFHGVRYEAWLASWKANHPEFFAPDEGKRP
jgi:hypothetical protein